MKLSWLYECVSTGAIGAGVGGGWATINHANRDPKRKRISRKKSNKHTDTLSD